MSDNTPLIASGYRASALTPDDDNDVSMNFTRGLYVGTGGDVAVILKLDTAAVTFVNVADGSLLPLQVKRLMATGTTATDIVGVY